MAVRSLHRRTIVAEYHGYYSDTAIYPATLVGASTLHRNSRSTGNTILSCLATSLFLPGPTLLCKRKKPPMKMPMSKRLQAIPFPWTRFAISLRAPEKSRPRQGYGFSTMEYLAALYAPLPEAIVVGFKRAGQAPDPDKVNGVVNPANVALLGKIGEEIEERKASLVPNPEEPFPAYS